MLDGAGEDVGVGVDIDLRPDDDRRQDERLRHEGAVTPEKAQLPTLHRRKESAIGPRGFLRAARRRHAGDAFPGADRDDAVAQLVTQPGITDARDREDLGERYRRPGQRRADLPAAKARTARLVGR